MNYHQRRFDGDNLQEDSFVSYMMDPEPIVPPDEHPIEDQMVDRRLLEMRDREIQRLRVELAHVKQELRETKLQLKLATIQPIPHDEDATMESQSSAGRSLSTCTFTPSRGSSAFSTMEFLRLWKTSPVVEADDEVSVEKMNSVNEKKQEINNKDEDLENVFQQPVLDPYGDKGIYTGQISKQSGWPHGHGRLEYEDQGTQQRVYDGEWCHGRWHGVGKANFANGDSYDGDYKLDQRHGYGIYMWADGRCYDGQFQEDKRHGKGTFRWPDGSVYVGEFVAGQREGEGTYNFGGGCKYVGNWSNGRYEGVGTCVWADGRCYSGYWVNGLKHGQGIETGPDGEVRHDGLWDTDTPIAETSTDDLASLADSVTTATKQKGHSRRFPRWSSKKTAEKA